MKLDGSVTDATDKVEPVDTAADVDCEIPPTCIVVVDIGAPPELETRLKVIVVDVLLPLMHKSIEVILTSLLALPLIVTAAALYVVPEVAAEIICEPNCVDEVHVDIELSKVCCPFTTFKVNK